MLWLFVALAGYTLLVLSDVINKYLLESSLPNPRFFTFSVGMLGGLVIVLIPFGVVSIPALGILILALSAGALRLAGLFSLFYGLSRFEVSRIIPAIGGFLPLFVLALTMILPSNSATLSFQEIAALALLILGSVVVSIEGKKFLTLQSLAFSAITALLFAFSFALSKFVYEAEPFLSGLFWIFIGSTFASLFLLLFSDVREKAFGMFSGAKKKTTPLAFKVLVIFLLAQILGGGAIVLQNLAVALVPFGQLAFVHALEGTQYVLLFLLTIIISAMAPSLLREEISKRAIIQKVLSLVLIGVGIVLLAF